jgi:hypothetical protein
MGTAQLVITSSNLTKAQWDAILVNIAAFIAANPGLGLTLDKRASYFQETPP